MFELFIRQIFLLLSRNNLTAYAFPFEIDFTPELLNKLYYVAKESLFTGIYVSLQSYHDPESEEEDAHHVSEIVAGASVSSRYTVSQLDEEKQTHNDEIERERVEEEDLPEQPPPAEEKPKEGNIVIVKVIQRFNEVMRMLTWVQFCSLCAKMWFQGKIRNPMRTCQLFAPVAPLADSYIM